VAVAVPDVSHVTKPLEAVAESKQAKSEWLQHVKVHNGYYIVRSVKTGHFRLADKYWNIISKPYEQIKGFRNTKLSFNSQYSVVRNNVKFGFIDLTGREIASPQYAAARNFSNRLAAVKVGDKWGFINDRNEMAIEPQYDQIVQDFFRETAVVAKKNRVMRINKKGEKLKKL
ncbi:MAG: WG repeat-containing protein, partial [Cyclobacteriaceae bacterium]